MGEKLPLLKPRAVLRALLRAGFYVHHQTGSHAQLRHVVKAHLRVTVPRHDRFDLPRAVLKSILQQAELTVDQFIALL